MLNGYTVFTTYLLKPTVVAGGYSPAIHCNYIQSVVLNTTIPQIEEIRFYFPEINDFKFAGRSVFILPFMRFIYGRTSCENVKLVFSQSQAPQKT